MKLSERLVAIVFEQTIMVRDLKAHVLLPIGGACAFLYLDGFSDG